MIVKSCEKLEKSRVALEIAVGAEEFEAAVEKAYLKMRENIHIPGFRAGKAPRKMIEKMYGAEVFYDEALDIVLPDACEAAAREQSLDVVGYPEVKVKTCGAEGVTFQIVVPVYPEVKLGQYKGLKAPRAEVKVTAADVDQRLKELADQEARLLTVERAVGMGDTAEIDFEGFDQGVPFEGGKGEKFDLEIGSGSFIPGFEEQLVGMKAGEEQDIRVTFPEEYPEESLAGKPVVFHVKVNEVKAKELPLMDDEFAKDVSEFETLAELKDDLAKKITAEREEAAQEDYEKQLLTQVAEGIEAEIPQDMIDLQVEKMIKDFKRQLAMQGLPYEQYLRMAKTTEEDFEAQAADPALAEVKKDLAVSALLKAENIQISDEEIEEEFQKIAKRNDIELALLKEHFSADLVREDLSRARAVDLIVRYAAATDPAAEE